MEENTNMDTPQPQTANTTGMDAFGAPAESEGSTDNNLSVEDAFFGSTEGETQETPAGNSQEDSRNNAETGEPYTAKNDDTRYEYWQSQAAQRENELKAYKSQVEQAVMAQQQQARQAPVQQPQGQDFPPPPPKPEKPRNFSREEAWSDSSSESAKYLDDVEVWQDRYNHYRDLRSQYDVALVRERVEAQDEQRRVAEARRAEYNATQATKNKVYEHVQGHYGLNPNDAAEFVQTMSDPNSISMDNLVQLYRMNQGAPDSNPSQGPSDAFQQSKNAQQIPSPMGVMPGQATESNRSDADTIMDDLINSHKSKNPWT